jgi:hypothetical protein
MTNVNEFYIFLCQLNEFNPLEWIYFIFAFYGMNALIRANKEDVFRVNVKSTVNTNSQISLTKLSIEPIEKVIFHTNGIKLKLGVLMLKCMIN